LTAGKKTNKPMMNKTKALIYSGLDLLFCF
jgi:hypothetical protein